MNLTSDEIMQIIRAEIDITAQGFRDCLSQMQNARTEEERKDRESAMHELQVRGVGLEALLRQINEAEWRKNHPEESAAEPNADAEDDDRDWESERAEVERELATDRAYTAAAYGADHWLEFQ